LYASLIGSNPDLLKGGKGELPRSRRAIVYTRNRLRSINAPNIYQSQTFLSINFARFLNKTIFFTFSKFVSRIGLMLSVMRRHELRRQLGLNDDYDDDDDDDVRR